MILLAYCLANIYNIQHEVDQWGPFPCESFLAQNVENFGSGYVDLQNDYRVLTSLKMRLP